MMPRSCPTFSVSKFGASGPARTADPDLVIRRAHREVLTDSALAVALMVSLSNHESVAPARPVLAP
jgi:hypothetical protein